MHFAGDISSESIGNTKSTREFWEKKASESEEGLETQTAAPVHDQIAKLTGSATTIRRGGSFRDATRVSRIPVLKPSGKEYPQEAESVPHRAKYQDAEDGGKLNIEAMREHWEKNQRKWGSSHVINAEPDGQNGGEDATNENGGSGLAEIERSTNFKDLKEQWKKKNTDRLGRPETVKDVNENCAIDKDRDKSPGFQALKEEWESKTQEADESL